MGVEKRSKKTEFRMDMMPPLTEKHVSLSTLLERAKEMSRSNDHEYRFVEERHNDIAGYEQILIHGENGADGSGLARGAEPQSG